MKEGFRIRRQAKKEKDKEDELKAKEEKIILCGNDKGKRFFEDLLCENKKRERSYSLPFCRRTIEKLTGCQSLC